MKNIFKTKVKWFKSEPIVQEWTHVYINSLGNPKRCFVVSDRSYTNARQYTVINEGGVTVYLYEEDLETISEYNKRLID